MAEEKTERSDIRDIVQAAIQEFVKAEQSKAEPLHKAELLEERRRRESLEQRVNELAAEAERARAKAEEAERSAAIRAELQKLGVAKVDLAYRVVRDDIVRSEDGRLMTRDGSEMKEHLGRFVAENPELMPARLTGGSGASGGQRHASGHPPVEMEKIKPGMSAEEMDRVRQEIVRVASQKLRGM